MKNKYLNTICLVGVLSTLLIGDMNGQYPFLPQNEQKFINGTVGEERGGSVAAGTRANLIRTRYHYGFDLEEDNGEDVYAIQTGNFSIQGGAVVVGEHAYVHTIPDATLLALWNNPDNRPLNVDAGTIIGTVSHGHVHLQQGNGDLDVSDMEDPDGNWINAITTVNPVDNEEPRIEWARLYRDSDHDTDISNQTLLYGQVDILINTEDERIEPDGTGRGFGIAPLDMTFETELNGTTIDEIGGISFRTVPPNTSAITVHGPNANWQTPNFEYWLTHDAFSTPYDKYWNIRKYKDGQYSSLAHYPWDAEYQDASNLKIKTTSCDHTPNCDDYYVQAP